MNESQISTLWAFARGDLASDAFEYWLFDQSTLELSLGQDLYLELLSANYADRHDVWNLRQQLRIHLSPITRCECPKIKDISAIFMGGDMYFEKVFASHERVIDHGPDKWWLYIDRCKVCLTIWLIAQDDRIYDEFFLARIDEQALEAAGAGQWPQLFLTYESVLAAGRRLSTPPRFLDDMAASLRWAVEDLIKEDPTISSDEIADLLGLSNEHAERLVRKVRPSWSRLFRPKG